MAPRDPLAGKCAITLGEALYDCLADQLGLPKEQVKSWTPHPGGAPANVATGIARLGAHSAFIGALGQDELGDQFLALLQERSVDTSHVQRNVHPSRDILVERTMDGDRNFAGFGKAQANEYADCFLDAGALPLDKIKAADALVTGTLGLAYPGSAAAMRAAVAAAKEGRHTCVIIDVNWRPVFWSDPADAKATVLEYIEQADILKVTDEEAEWLWGIPRADALQHPERVLAKAAPSTRGVLVSAGEMGSSYAFKGPGATSKQEMSGVVPVLDIKVLDTTGAGDAYLAGFIFYMLRVGSLDSLTVDPEELHHAVEFGTACGAFTCTKPGAIGAQPTLAEAEELLAAKSGEK